MEENLSRSDSRSSSVCDLEKDFGDMEIMKKSRKSVILRKPPARKAKRVRFFRNGDKFYSGVMIPVLAERYRSFDSLTADLTRVLVDNVTLPSGVRAIYSLEGKKISNLDELEDGKSYVCSGKGETFKKLDYNSLSSSRLGTPENPNGPAANNMSGDGIKPNQNNRLSRIYNGAGSPYATSNGASNGRVTSGVISAVRPRIVTIIRNGIKPRKVFRLLLNKRNSPSFEHVLSAITECIKLDTGCVRRVFTLAARPVLQLEHFFQEEDVFFAYGNERYSQEDFELEFEESKAVQQYKKAPALRNSTKNGPKPKMPVKVGKEHKKGIKSGSPDLDNANNADEDEETNNLELPQPLRLKYLVGRIIGDGNFAVVRYCQERVTGREFALKIIDKAKCQGKEYYVEAEVRIMRRVCHPRIVTLIGEYDTPDKFYLVMELVKGGDLFDSITFATFGKFSEPQARLMINHLASAIAYLHSMWIVHRDIKPENLLVESVGDRIVGLKLGDFGLACEVDKPLYTVCGTPTYVAPEILLETGYGMKIDVWAMGVILYILLCGFPPFCVKDNNQDSLFDAIILGQYEFPTAFWYNVSHGARDLINNMLQPSPDCRYGAEDVLDHPWLSDDYVDDQPNTYDDSEENEAENF